MRRCILLFAVLFLALAAELLVSRAEADKDDITPQVAELVRQLNHDRFAKREAAGKALIALGEPVLPALRKAAASTTDLDLRRRIKRVIEDITPPLQKSKSLDLELVLIDAGDFQMGSPNLEVGRRGDESLHRVRITRPYYLGAYEVTQDEFQKVMKVNPSWFSKTGQGMNRIVGENVERYPVDQVSWFDAVAFCNRLSEMDGYKPYYKMADVKKDKDAIVGATVTIVGGNGYRLPTEAEWEYACRAGKTTAYGHGEETKRGQANYKPMLIPSGYGSAPKWQDLQRTTKVGSYPANPWGLYDMHGNASEWCEDWYDKDYYTVSPKDDPTGPMKGNHRVIRGGSWLVTDASCRSASRFFHAPDERKYYGGFRIARRP